MSSYTAPKFHDFAELRGRHTDQSPSEPTAAVTKLTPGAGLLMAFSLGLWAAIWQAVSTLAAVW